MGFLQGKKILITGMISNRSIAYGIAQACHRQGAELAFTYVVDKLEDRVRELAAEFGSSLVYRCDVQNDQEIEQLVEIAFAVTRYGKDAMGCGQVPAMLLLAQAGGVLGDQLDMAAGRESGGLQA